MKMLVQFLLLTLLFSGSSWGDEGKEFDTGDWKRPELKFSDPVRLKVGDEIIAVEKPGFASPCLSDMDGDGLKDLLVGQFNGGKIMVYKGKEKGEYKAGEFLRADGQTAEIPGVW